MATHSDSQSRFWTDNLILGSATALTAILGYFFYTIMAHHLGPNGYGALASLFNLLALWMLPAPLVGLYYMRTGRWPNARRRLTLLGLGITLFLASLALTPPLALTLHISSYLFPLYGMTLVPQFWLAANMGWLQRQRAFFQVGLLIVGNQASQDLGAWSAAQVSAATSLIVLGAFELAVAWATVLVSQWLTNRCQTRASSDRVDSRSVNAVILYGVFVAGALGQGFVTADGLIAQANLSATAAGQLNGLATLVHTFPDAATALATVMFTTILARPSNARTVLRRTIALYLGIALVALALFALFPHRVVSTVLGRGFSGQEHELVPYAVAMATLGVLDIVALFSVALNRWQLITTMALGFLIWLIMLFRQTTVAQFINVSNGVTISTLALTLLVWTASSEARGGRQPDRQTAPRKALDRDRLRAKADGGGLEPPPGPDPTPESDQRPG